MRKNNLTIANVYANIPIIVTKHLYRRLWWSAFNLVANWSFSSTTSNQRHSVDSELCWPNKNFQRWKQRSDLQLRNNVLIFWKYARMQARWDFLYNYKKGSIAESFCCCEILFDLILYLDLRSDGRRHPCVTLASPLYYSCVTLASPLRHPSVTLASLLRHPSATLLSVPLFRKLSGSTSIDSCVTY